MWSRISIAAIAGILALASVPSYAQDSKELAMMEQFMSVMDGYFSIIESTHDIAATPEKSAILQMQKIKEIYEERGEGAKAIGVLREVLNQTNNPTVRSAAVLILSDLLKENGRSDAAIEVLQEGLKESIARANAAGE